MARYNEIQVGRYNRYLQKLLSMKGEVPAPQLGSEISTFIQLFHGVENRYLEGWDRFANLITQGGIAAIFSAVRMRNPSGSNVIAVFEKLSVFAGGTMLVDLQRATTTLDLSSIVVNPPGQNLDSRARPFQTLIASRSAAVAPFGLNQIQQQFIPTNPSVDFILTVNSEIPLLPGDAIQFIGETAAVNLTANFLWRERFLEDSERA